MHRSHQFVDHGYKVMHHGHLLTVFSARNYFMKQSGLKNDSAILLVAEDVRSSVTAERCFGQREGALLFTLRCLQKKKSKLDS